MTFGGLTAHGSPLRDGFAVLVVAVTLVATTAAVQTSRSASLERYEFSEPHMGTLVRIVVYAASAAGADDAAHAAFARIAALDEIFSDYRESSELMRLSRRSGGEPVEVSEDLFRVLRAAEQVGRDSGGAFDVTAAPLSLLWRQARRQGRLPGGEDLAAARAVIGLDKLVIDERRRTIRLLQPGMQLDLGGIAKGFAADEAAVTLAARGISSALIAAGGDIVATGAPPERSGWRVAIAAIEGSDPAGFVTLRDAAISTSGDAEQFVTIDGVRYSHIFDPRTGLALTGRRSVSVLASNGTASDALATAVSVMGATAGLRLVDGTNRAAAFVAEMAPGGLRTYESSRWRALSGFRAN